ncbi:MAG: hypothetical protein VW709_01595 [Rickettsiales bacterium]|jgi:hypothetical protein
MGEPPDINDIAKRYLDLWQDQMSGMAADPEWIAAMSRLCLSAGAAGDPARLAENFTAGLEALKASFDGTTGGAAGDAKRQQTEVGSAPAAGASDDGGDDIRELRHRLAALEERLARLEDSGKKD